MVFGNLLAHLTQERRVVNTVGQIPEADSKEQLVHAAANPPR